MGGSWILDLFESTGTDRFRRVIPHFCSMAQSSPSDSMLHVEFILCCRFELVSKKLVAGLRCCGKVGSAREGMAPTLLQLCLIEAFATGK